MAAGRLLQPLFHLGEARLTEVVAQVRLQHRRHRALDAQAARPVAVELWQWLPVCHELSPEEEDPLPALPVALLPVAPGRA